jgi:hypothetical protein
MAISLGILVPIVAASSLMFSLQRFQFLEQIVAFMQLSVCAGRGASTQCTAHPKQCGAGELKQHKRAQTIHSDW